MEKISWKNLYIASYSIIYWMCIASCLYFIRCGTSFFSYLQDTFN